jgi:hypothetical protein
MSDHNEFTLEKIIPTWRQIEHFVNNPVWKELTDYLHEAYLVEPKFEFNSAMHTGWSVMYRRNNKPFCVLHPMRNYFTVLVVLGLTEISEMEFLLPSFTKQVQKAFLHTRTNKGLKRMMFEVRDEETLRDAMDIIAIRAKRPEATS